VGGVWIRFIRYGIPVLMFAAGFIVLFAGGKANALDGWAMLVGSALALITFNVLLRIGASGDGDRDREAAARRYYTEHGHWPDEPPPRHAR
jgi:hypothetical protein